MTPHLRSMYHLAEHLHMPVSQLSKVMTVSEYMGWLTFFSEKAVNPEDRGNAVAADAPDEDILQAFGRIM
jgi:hypothetical protein